MHWDAGAAGFSVIARPPLRSGAYCLIVSIYNVFARGCFGVGRAPFSPLVMQARAYIFWGIFLSSGLPSQIADAAKVAKEAF